MNKEEVKSILYDMFEHSEDEKEQEIIAIMIGELIGKTDDEILAITRGLNEEQIRAELIRRINRMKRHTIEGTTDSPDKYKVNDIFEYGIAGDSAHLHLPGDFHELFRKNGIVKSSAYLAKKLLDAVQTINSEKENGDIKLKECTGIYMISPIFYAPSFNPKVLRRVKSESQILRMFKLMNAQTRSYMQDKLQNDEFVASNPEARLAVDIFGKKRDIGVASISFETINSEKWQRKAKRVERFLEKISKKVEKEEREEEDRLL